MKNTLILLGALVLAQMTTAGELPPQFAGDWRGEWVNPTNTYLQNSNQITAQVIGLGGDLYQVTFKGEFERRSEPIFSGTGRYMNGMLTVAGDYFRCNVTDDLIEGAGVYKGDEVTEFRLTKFTRLSPTLGRKAPKGAVVLFDGTSLDAWQHVEKDGSTNDPVWKVVDSVIESVPKKENKKGGDLVSKQKFKSCELHIEFKLPYEPENRGQGRANSGVFLQGTYEVQMLDSYGLIGDWSECGALYKVAPPKVNRCSPPEQWQTYDIIYRAAQYDADGKLVKYPVITVRQNGEFIHKQQELYEQTQYYRSNRILPPPQDPGPIILQDHGHAIQYRNIWVKEME